MFVKGITVFESFRYDGSFCPEVAAGVFNVYFMGVQPEKGGELGVQRTSAQRKEYNNYEYCF